MALVWRNGGPKCGLQAQTAVETEKQSGRSTSTTATALLRGGGQQRGEQGAAAPGQQPEANGGAVHSMVWFYTYE